MTRLGAGGLTILAACAACTPPTSRDYQWDIPADYPRPVVPDRNPMTAAKVALGRHLFFDVRLSWNGEQACASCHRPEHAFSEPRQTAVGSTGERHARNTLALVNVAYNDTFMWAHPGLRDIEAQTLVPLFGEDPVELGIAGHEGEVLARFDDDPDYQRLLGDAFPHADAFALDHVVDALACFVRSLISFDTPFDRYAYGGQDAAMDERAIRGLNHFFSERFECHHCHGGLNFTASSTHGGVALPRATFHNTGLYNVGGANAYPGHDQGLYELTEEPTDRGKFRAPTLRNVALTAPYMHDGSLPDLGAVLDFYAAGGRNLTTGPHVGDGRANAYKSQFVQGLDMTPEERDDLLAFLHALTDPSFVERAVRSRDRVAL